MTVAPRRRVLCFASAVSLSVVAGCAAFGDDWITEAANEPAYDDTVTIINRSNESLELELTVTHDGDEGTVYRERVTVEAESELETYDFREAPTDGVEVYVIEGRFSHGEAVSFRFPTHACRRDPDILVEEDGSPREFTSVC